MDTKKDFCNQRIATLAVSAIGSVTDDPKAGFTRNRIGKYESDVPERCL